MNTVSTILTMADRLGAWKVRWRINRMNYTFEPGIYAVNNPGADSVVLVSANYKLSFDVLRSQLEGLDAWILVLDTKGVNVWCAAGKGTFGTDELVKRIESSDLAKLVSHRNLIVPQLGAVGVSAHEVRKKSGFTVIYGPVHAADIKAFIAAGMKATESMRQVRFSVYDRLVLTPVEFVNSFKYLLLAVIVFFILSGLHTRSFSSRLMLHNGIIAVAVLVSAYAGGAILGPLLLPWLPGRSFALKGALLGFALTAVLWGIGLTGSLPQTAIWLPLIISIASFLVMMFTGSSTYTSLSGVRKEMRIAVPLQMLSAAAGLILWIGSRLV